MLNFQNWASQFLSLYSSVFCYLLAAVINMERLLDHIHRGDDDLQELFFLPDMIYGNELIKT
ncbi:16206_t:CDS:2, partial [Funneliformis geosporum]